MEQQGLKSKLRDFALSTTIHGLKDLIVEPSKCLKLIWTVFMVASVCVCCWQLYIAITEYQQGPTAMKPTVVSYDLLPPINFHVANVINMAKLKRMGLGVSHYKLILDRFPITRLYNRLNKSEAALARDQLQEAQEKKGFTDFSDFLKYVAYQPQELFSYHFGIVPEITLRINERGPWYEVKMNHTSPTVTDIGQPEDVKGLTSRVIVLDRVKYDDYIAINDVYRGLIESHSDLWISVGHDTHDSNKWHAIQQQTTCINIQSQMTKFIDRPSSPCSTKYQTVAECQNLCILETLKIPDSDCEWYSGQSINISRPCQGELDLQEMSYFDHCMKPEACPKACEVWSHSIDVTYSRPAYDREANRWIGILAGSTDVAVLEEYYTYSSITLFSNVGGILSLYIEASVLSIIHVIYYFSCKTDKWEKVSVSKKVISV